MKLFETIIAQQYVDWQKQLSNIIQFVIQNNDCILDRNSQQNVYYQRSSILTPISMIFSHLVDSEVIYKTFSPLVIESKVIRNTIPEILANPNFIVNLEELDNSPILNAYPHIQNTVIVNITPWISTSGGTYKVTDTNMLHGLFVKGALCKSYFQTKTRWLTPTLVSFIAKSYSMIISNIIASSFNLDITHEKFCRFLFANYFLQKLNNDTNIPAAGINTLGNIIGSQSDIESMVTDAFKSKSFGLTFSDTVQILHDHISTRIPTFSEFNLVRMCSGLMGDIVTSSIALEYPPYWVYGLLLAASFGKTGLSVRLKQLRLENDNKLFANNLNRCMQFIEILE